uniref:Uncharacterized protein n=1 Tax=Rhizobium leguminosarum TaxID=384 RepID=A0A179BUS1_RHILE|nr:hypothetical protein [Rhizobium leguminosarum]OAP95125.1 hypothetical protein A4U53_18055 [Rhizobium leguminosarum]
MEYMEARMQDRYEALSEEHIQSSDKAAVYDKTGRAIVVGDVLKVYHFTAALRRKKHFMYKQVAIADKFRDGTPIFRLTHLDLTDDFYTLICDGSHLPAYEIVQSIKCDHHDRPRHPAQV